MSHTIAAVSTGNQVSAIGIIRLTGDDCIAVAEKVFTLQNGRTLSGAPDRKLMLGTLHDKQGRIIDQCMAVVSRGPHSYTGEDTVEFHCHGSPAVLASGLESLYIAGAKPAKRGEYTKRAFLNGKLDLSEAESVMNMISAHGEQAANAAYHALEGSLSREIRSVSDVFIAAAAHMAAWADYPDEIYEEELDYDVLLGDFKAAYDKTKKETVLEAIDFPIVSYTINPDKATIIARHGLSEYMSKEDYKKIKPYLQDSINYTLQGHTFKPQR